MEILERASGIGVIVEMELEEKEQLECEGDFGPEELEVVELRENEETGAFLGEEYREMHTGR